MGDVTAKVLIADDQGFFRTLMRDLLTDGGFSVVAEASDGAEAVAMTTAYKPDIVILDVVMPGKNGLEAALDISRLVPRPKIVMCSSLDDGPIVKEAIESGADAFIYKPVNGPEVLKTLRGLL